MHALQRRFARHHHAVLVAREQSGPYGCHLPACFLLTGKGSCRDRGGLAGVAPAMQLSAIQQRFIAPGSQPDFVAAPAPRPSGTAKPRTTRISSPFSIRPPVHRAAAGLTLNVPASLSARFQHRQPQRRAHHPLAVDPPEPMGRAVARRKPGAENTGPRAHQRHRSPRLFGRGWHRQAAASAKASGVARELGVGDSHMTSQRRGARRECSASSRRKESVSVPLQSSSAKSMGAGGNSAEVASSSHSGSAIARGRARQARAGDAAHPGAASCCGQAGALSSAVGTAGCVGCAGCAQPASARPSVPQEPRVC